MSLSCDLIIDLIPLYKDGLASEASRSAIEEHLRECPTCRKYSRHYDAIEKEAVRKAESICIDDYMQSYSELSRRLRVKRNIFTGVAAGCACIAAASVVLYALERAGKKLIAETL